MEAMGSQTTSLTSVYSTVYSRRRSKKNQSSASLAFVRGIHIHRWPVNSPHKGPVTRKMFPFDDVLMTIYGCEYITKSVIMTLQMYPIIHIHMYFNEFMCMRATFWSNQVGSRLKETRVNDRELMNQLTWLNSSQQHSGTTVVNMTHPAYELCY